MSNPGIEIVWGGDLWRRARRRTVRPVAEEIAELTHAAFEELGVKYDKPKRMSLRRSGNNYPAGGASDGPVDFEIYFRVSDIKRRKVSRKFGQYFVNTAHEMGHNIRRESVDKEWNLVEEVAAEGVAHMAEDLAAAVVLQSGQFISNVSILQGVSKTTISQLKSQLLNESGDIHSRNEYDNVSERWFSWQRTIPPGYVLGVASVYQRLSEGHDFSEVIQWPATQILDLAV